MPDPVKKRYMVNYGYYPLRIVGILAPYTAFPSVYFNTFLNPIHNLFECHSLKINMSFFLPPTIVRNLCETMLYNSTGVNEVDNTGSHFYG